MSRDIVDRGPVKLTRYYGKGGLMYQLTVGTGYIQETKDEMEFLLIELLTELTNDST